ncbi:hypothetical protein ACFQ5D_12465 [Paenibacillus farraposensis]|uniref:Uncharacterized protein n=2 Tax=Paenibacillus farraposensis TaxID=2807095 RepID=A0ABW4DBY3_9BACL
MNRMYPSSSNHLHELHPDELANAALPSAARCMCKANARFFRNIAR